MRHEGAETCTDCHNPHGGENAKFLTSAAPELCFECHDDPEEAEGEVHPALEEGCLSCHDPHAGFKPAVLTSAGSAVCLECHDDPAADLPHRHGAVAQGCSGCHEPHVAKTEHFLRAKGTALCGTCHDFAGARQGIELHPPAEDCSECHAALAHGGQTPKSLSSTPPDLCVDCHDDPREGEGELHPALEEGCLVCHDPHAGYVPGFLKGESRHSACVECHDDPLEGKNVIHEALQQGCSACHEPHTSERAHFLRRLGNDLCKGCHDPSSHAHALDAKRGEDRFPASAAFPRSGDNWACQACHTPHASEEPGLFNRPRAELCGAACHGL
jgi:predicted CXXCH cytochrome family protein